MSAAGYRALEQEVLLNNGAGTQYALGLDVTRRSDRRVLAHGGSVSGFTSLNTIYPEARAAIVVLTNSDTAHAAPDITQKVEDLLFAVGTPADAFVSRMLSCRPLVGSNVGGKICKSPCRTSLNPSGPFTNL